MMQHLPMSTTVSIWAAAFSALYIQVISLGAILVGYHLLWNPVEVHQPVGALAMLGLAWFFGVAVGSILLAVKPWMPASSAARVAPRKASHWQRCSKGSGGLLAAKSR